MAAWPPCPFCIANAEASDSNITFEDGPEMLAGLDANNGPDTAN
jgi:hypothetical protein